MVDSAGGNVDDFERLARSSDVGSDGWQRTIEDMNAMAEDRAEAGFETLTIPAGNTAPVSPDAGDTDRWGLSHVIPGNKAESFERLYDAGTFTETGVYQAGVEGHVFIVTECLDPDAEIVIFIAGAYQMRHAPPLVRAATDRGDMYTHVKTLDGETLGTFEHDDAAAFFPDPEEFYAYERSR